MKSAVKDVQTEDNDLIGMSWLLWWSWFGLDIVIFDHDFLWIVWSKTTVELNMEDGRITNKYWATLNWKHAFIVLQWINSDQKTYL